jgi:energy-coupling factor transport system substrate-specific component
MQKFDLNNPRTLASTGIMIALVAALTYFGKLPVTTPTGGYIHLGDAAVFFASFAFGPWVGMIAGGVGCGLADILGGYAHFAPLTLLVHGLQGYLAGWIAARGQSPVRLGLAFLAGAAVVIGGYYIGEALIPALGGPAYAWLEIPGNFMQEGFGLIGIAVYLAVVRAYPRILQTTG